MQPKKSMYMRVTSMLPFKAEPEIGNVELWENNLANKELRSLIEKA
jgi:hypothetical protein